MENYSISRLLAFIQNRLPASEMLKMRQYMAMYPIYLNIVEGIRREIALQNRSIDDDCFDIIKEVERENNQDLNYFLKNDC